MNIIFSTYEAKEIGGSYLRSLALAQGLVKLGHNVTLWTSAKTISLWPKFSEENGVRVVESLGLFPYRIRKGGYDPLDLLFRSLVILFCRCDVINSFNHRPAATLPALLKVFFCPQAKWFLDWADFWGKGGIADLRVGPFRFFTKNIDHYMERLMISLPYAVTAISDDLLAKAMVLRHKKLDNKKVFFLGVGANIDGIKPIDKHIARKELGFSQHTKYLVYLYVGTYDEVLLAKTFIELNKLRSDVKLLLLGPQMALFKQTLSRQPSLHKKVIDCGVVDRNMLPLYLAAGDLMLLPFADKEINRGKFPNKLGDYLAAGRPTVANPTGEVKKVFEREEVGVLAPEEPRVFAQTISETLDQPAKMRRFSQKARSLAERLSWVSVAKQLEGLYLQ